MTGKSDRKGSPSISVARNARGFRHSGGDGFSDLRLQGTDVGVDRGCQYLPDALVSFGGERR